MHRPVRAQKGNVTRNPSFKLTRRKRRAASLCVGRLEAESEDLRHERTQEIRLPELSRFFGIIIAT
jgi:hypothetical protein